MQFFAATSGSADAPLLKGFFPTIILSHGGLRSATDSGAWISARLAAQGYIVAEVNSPIPSPQNALAEFWSRSDSLSSALTALLQDKRWSSHIDHNRITAVGFHMGGTAALSLAGGLIDSNVFLKMCDDNPRSIDCQWFSKHKIDLNNVNMAALTQSRLDARFSTIIAVDPEYTALFSPVGLRTLPIPLSIIRLGSSDTNQLPDEINSVQEVTTEASAADAFAPCTQKGPVILAEEDEDPSIRGKDANHRLKIHDLLETNISSILNQIFNSPSGFKK